MIKIDKFKNNKYLLNRLFSQLVNPYKVLGV